MSTRTLREILPSIPVGRDTEFNAAKRLYAEQWGDAVVTNTYLKLVIVALCLVTTGMLYLHFSDLKALQSFKPLVIRIDSVGRAEAMKYDTLTYRPQDGELKYFLSEFCRMYYGRNPQTIRENFKTSLLYMDSQLASATLAAWTKQRTIANYLENPQAEQDIQVQRVDIEDLRSPPYKATVAYKVLYLSPIDRNEIRNAQFTAHFVFALRDSVPNDLILSNPLGFAISYFREDEAFK